MQITQINEAERTCPPNVGNRSFRPSYLGPYFRIESRTINLLMCDFISDEIYLKSKIYPEPFPTRNDAHFFRAHLFSKEFNYGKQ